MFLEVVLAVLLTLTLFGLAKSTENVLNIRQKQRDQGNDPKIYL